MTKANQSPKSKPKKANQSEKRALSSGEREEIRELFEDVYISNKWRIMRMNFLRGIFFGLGTFLGGTIVVAVVIWVLSQTVDLFPWAQDFTERLINSLQKR
jgi:hypothetical protein